MYDTELNADVDEAGEPDMINAHLRQIKSSHSNSSKVEPVNSGGEEEAEENSPPILGAVQFK